MTGATKSQIEDLQEELDIAKADMKSESDAEMKEVLQISIDEIEKEIAELKKSAAPAKAAPKSDDKGSQSDGVSDKEAKEFLEDYYKGVFFYPSMDAINKAKSNGVEALVKKYDLGIIQARTIVKNWTKSRFKIKTQKASDTAKNKPSESKTPPAAAKPKKSTSSKTASKKSDPAPKPTAKASAPKPKYSWKSKTDVGKLDKIEFTKDHFAIQVKEPTLVKIKGEGKDSIMQTAQPGEWLIFDSGGYLVYIMMKTVGDRKFKIVKDEPTKKTKPATKAPAPKSAKKPTSAPKKAEKPAPKKKRANCTLKDAETGRRLAKVENYFIDHATDFKEKKGDQKKIYKIMRLKDSGSIILEMASWKGMGRALLNSLMGNRVYYRLCIDKLTLKKIDKHPAQGTYNIIIGEKQMRKIYTTKGPKMYEICVKTYRELLKCSFEGKCTLAQKAKWKSSYQDCGDLIVKLEKNPEGMKAFHVEVKSRRKRGEKYSAAMSRVATEIKASFQK